MRHHCPRTVNFSQSQLTAVFVVGLWREIWASLRIVLLFLILLEHEHVFFASSQSDKEEVFAWRTRWFKYLLYLVSQFYKNICFSAEKRIRLHSTTIHNTSLRQNRIEQLNDQKSYLNFCIFNNLLLIF